MEIERTAFVDFVENDKVRLLTLLLPLLLSNFGLLPPLSCQLLIPVVPNKTQPWFCQGSGAVAEL